MGKSRIPKHLDRNRLIEKVSYDPDTGVFTWNKLTVSYFDGNKNPERDCKTHNSLWAGRVAGSIGWKSRRGMSPQQRMFICIDQKMYDASIVAMAYMGDYQEGMIVDHINGNPLDNRACNLRMVTAHQNSMNSSNVGRSVEYCPKRNRWRPCLYVGGKRIRKGRFLTKGGAMAMSAKLSLMYFGKYSPFARKLLAS